MKTTTTTPSLSTFGKTPKGVVRVPTPCLGIRNNCQEGNWASSNRAYGSSARLIICGFENFFGNLGKTYFEHWGQAWCVCIEGDLPKNVIFVTYLKTESLANLNELVNTMPPEIEPANGIFTPTFQRRENRYGKYWAITWSWEALPQNDPRIIAVATARNEHIDSLYDLTATKQMISLEGMNKEMRQAVIADFKEQYQQAALEAAK